MKCLAVTLPWAKSNLDRYYVDEQNDFYAVMDGTTAGGEFSLLFVEWLKELVERRCHQLADTPHSVGETGKFFKKLIEEADRSIHERMEEHFGGRSFGRALGAGSTLVLAHRVADQWVVASSGDSVAWIVKESAITQLNTKDTTFNEWIRRGQVELDEAGKPIFTKYTKDGNDWWEFKGISTNWRGLMSAIKRMERWVGNSARPNLYTKPAKADDALILLTDGAQHVIDLYCRDDADSTWAEKVSQAVHLVRSGQEPHLLAAIDFWDTYNPDHWLGDDATALVVYEG